MTKQPNYVIRKKILAGSRLCEDTQPCDGNMGFGSEASRSVLHRIHDPVDVFLAATFPNSGIAAMVGDLM
jgi:hypothetical protein